MFFFRKKVNKRVRLFLCTGNISLINILSFLKSQKNKNYVDILGIATGCGKEEFINENIKIAKSHHFNKVFFKTDVNDEDFATVIKNQNLPQIDEIYAINHPVHLEAVEALYPDVPLTLMDEGCGSLINYDLENVNNLQQFITHKYINKFDFWGLKRTDIKFNYFDSGIFRKIASILSKKNPIKYKSKKDDKYILFCSTYWQVSGLDKDTFAKLQCDMINQLIEKGYKILYKAHPRENEKYGYEDNPNLQIITSKFPIELYKLDILAIVSTSCSALINYPHYWGIPSFSNVLDEAVDKYENFVMINLIRFIIRQYSPNYEKLLELDVKNTSKKDLKLQIKEYYDDFIKSKPLLSENKDVFEYDKKMENQKF